MVTTEKDSTPKEKTELTQEQKEGLQDMAMLLMAKGKQKKELEKKLVKKYVDKKPDKPKKTPKEILNEAKNAEELASYEEGKFNWLDDDTYYDSFDKIKGHLKKLWNNGGLYNKDIPWKKFFIAHSKDKISGKLQLIEDVKVRLPLTRMAVKKIKVKDTDELFPHADEDGKVEVQNFYIIGDKFDKRHDGFQKDADAYDNYKYITKTPDDKRYFIFSENKLPEQTCTVEGMAVELDDVTEMNKNMKIPMLSSIFFAKNAKPDVKIISKKELVEYTKKNNINEFDWLLHLATHRFGTINSFPLETEMLKSAWILSGKVDGWPLHLCIIGPTGTRKTMGWAETIGNCFSEEGDGFIMDSGNSTLKGLIPSYKGTITEPGFIAKAERVAIIDEFMKLVERELKKHDSGAGNIMGELNPILEHKDRKVYSGNTAECNMTTTAKAIFIGNPLSNKYTINSHVGEIDPSVMSRKLYYVQDKDEQRFVLGENGIIRPSNKDVNEGDENPPETLLSIGKWDNVIENRKKSIVLKKSRGKFKDRNAFLTLFDSCYVFLSDIDDSEVYRLVKSTMALAEGKMVDVWEPRSYHHVKLLIDGLCKHRCLFRDYDDSFTAKKEDYDMAERILIRMVNSWRTDFSMGVDEE